ncbi:hypothetical protein ACJMK2_005203 [Sinanodonta woodiana]|uniref:G-protein coupled receptors family 1 profile domain-containing protein n=1 Tax=Sinanodonta woodiana TaxID=1069815 RepID=A0ABD3VPC8_SINWO
MNVSRFTEYLSTPMDVSDISTWDTNEVVPTSMSPPSRLQLFSVEYAKVHGYISVCVCAFGILANIANIVILTRKNMVSSTNVILTWLAVADLFTMLDYFPFAMHFYILKEQDLNFPETRGYGWMVYLLFHANFSIVCHTVAIWLTIVLATFRFIYIWFPAKGGTYCTVQRAMHISSICVVTTVCLCIPNFVINNMAPYQKNMDNSSSNPTEPDIVYKLHYRSGGVYNVIDTMNKMIQAIIFKIIPCCLLTILTVLLITAMHKAYKKRMALKNQGKRKESDKHGENNRTTGMLLAVVVLFLITELPQGILTILALVMDTFFMDVYMPLGDLLDIMALCNNAINFVLYCSMSRQFRETFIKVFCRCYPTSGPGWMKMKVVRATENGGSTVIEHSQTHV